MESLETDLGLFEVMYGCRSMRRLRPDPVPDELLVKLVEAGTQAPSSANAQNWRFVIVRDRDVLLRIAEPWRRGIALLVDNSQRVPARAGEDLDQRRRTLAAVSYLADHLPEMPALICVCVEHDQIVEKSARNPAAAMAAVRHLGFWGSLKLGRRVKHNIERELWATAYPAAQNILLTARAMGLGAVMTMPMVLAPPGTYERILELPKTIELAAMIPVGYPQGRFGAVTRPAAESFISWDRYESG